MFPLPGRPGRHCRGALGKHEAISHYQQAVSIFREIADRRGEAAALIGLGDAHLAVGHREDARHSWERALTLATATPGGGSPAHAGLASLAKTN